jgi:hypothetical protein
VACAARVLNGTGEGLVLPRPAMQAPWLWSQLGG